MKGMTDTLVLCSVVLSIIAGLELYAWLQKQNEIADMQGILFKTELKERGLLE